MDTLIIVGVIIVSIYIFHSITILHIKRHDAELRDIQKEISKRDALWADLLKQIHEIKLFQSTKH